MQYSLNKWSFHGAEKNGFTYRIFHLSDFWENASFTNKKKEEWKKETKNKFHKSFLVDLTSVIQIIKYT